MKLSICLLVTFILLGLLIGCREASTEVTYKEVSVGSMRLNIPTNWQKPDDLEEAKGVFTSMFGAEETGYITVDGYIDSKITNLALVIIVMEMSKIYEVEGEPWEGWESEFENLGMTKKDFLTLFSAGMLAAEGTEEITLKETKEHIIHDCEAIEGQYSGKMEGEQTIATILLIFSENDLGMLILVVHKTFWGRYEDTWNEIRDSIHF